MPIYKYISLKEVIAKYFRDHKRTDPGLWQDMVEWAGEALQWIGNGFTARQILNLECDVKNRMLCLPCDFIGNPQVMYAGKKVLPLEGTMIPIFTNADFADELEEKIDTSTLLTGSKVPHSNLDYKYWIEDCYMKFNFDADKITISYLAFRTDNDGFPLVPDIIEYKTAITSYWTKMIRYPEYLDGKLRDGIWDRVENDWDHRCMQARVEALKPDLDKLESIKNMWNRLIPDPNAATQFYFNLNTPDIPSTQ